MFILPVGWLPTGKNLMKCDILKFILKGENDEPGNLLYIRRR